VWECEVVWCGVVSFFQFCQLFHRNYTWKMLFLDTHSYPPSHTRSLSLSLPTTATRGRGTPAYMAPEVVAGRNYGSSADVYSFGMLLFVIFTSREPFDTLSYLEMSRAIGQGTTPTLPADVKSVYRDLIRSCWAAPDNRPSFEVLFNKLGRLCQQLSFLHVTSELMSLTARKLSSALRLEDSAFDKKLIRRSVTMVGGVQSSVWCQERRGAALLDDCLTSLSLSLSLFLSVLFP
jgi:serine/threonine protein kinase